MSVQFYSIGSDPFLKCDICLQKSDEELVTHDERHFMHQECAKLWIKKHPTCPTCRADVDPSSLFSWKERIIHRIEKGDVVQSLENMRNVASATIGANFALLIDSRREFELSTRLMFLLTATAIGGIAPSRLRVRHYQARALAMMSACSVVFLTNAIGSFLKS